MRSQALKISLPPIGCAPRTACNPLRAICRSHAGARARARASMLAGTRPRSLCARLVVAVACRSLSSYGARAIRRGSATREHAPRAPRARARCADMSADMCAFCFGAINWPCCASANRLIIAAAAAAFCCVFSMFSLFDRWREISILHLFALCFTSPKLLCCKFAASAFIAVARNASRDDFHSLNCFKNLAAHL